MFGNSLLSLPQRVAEGGKEAEKGGKKEKIGSTLPCSSLPHTPPLLPITPIVQHSLLTRITCWLHLLHRSHTLRSTYGEYEHHRRGTYISTLIV